MSYKGQLTKGSKHACGYDLHACENVIIPKGSRKLIPTGVYTELNEGTWGLIKSRSGLACKGIDNGAGVIDSDYRGEIKVLLINNSNADFEVMYGDRIAQLVILPHLNLNASHTLIVNDRIRGDKGFGSSGN